MSSPHRGRSSVPSVLSGEQRINKLLAAAGFGSRRQVDELITEGRVEVDGKLVTQVGIKVDADNAKILVDGEPLKRHRPVYYAVHKPAGVLCTNCDPEGRPRVIELVPTHARLFPVGRLDASSTGLILLTNDGELAQRLAHPKYCVPKSYFVVVAGQVDRDALKRLQRGIYLAEGIARVDGATIRKVRKGCTEIDITLSEGKNREIRRVLARLGHKVVVLRRVSIASLRLGDMPEGSYRMLGEKEVAGLYQAIEEIKTARNQERRERKKRSLERAGDGPRDRAVVTNEKGKPTRNKKPTQAIPFDEEGDEGMFDDRWDAEGVLDSLPSLSDNPFRQADDVEQDDEFDDAILVRNTEAGFDPDLEGFSKEGAVLGFDDEEEVVAPAEDRRPPRPWQDTRPRQDNRRGNPRSRNASRSSRPMTSRSGGESRGRSNTGRPTGPGDRVPTDRGTNDRGRSSEAGTASRPSRPSRPGRTGRSSGPYNRDRTSGEGASASRPSRPTRFGNTSRPKGAGRPSRPRKFGKGSRRP
jgi:23S rRNA pseudouridine2605 synthase